MVSESLRANPATGYSLTDVSTLIPQLINISLTIEKTGSDMVTRIL